MSAVAMTEGTQEMLGSDVPVCVSALYSNDVDVELWIEYVLNTRLSQ